MFKINFQQDSQSVNYEKIVLTDTTDYIIPDADVTGVFRVLFPNGYLYEGDINNPDINGALSFEFLLNIPKDAVGNYLEGTYEITYKNYNQGVLISEETKVFKYCDPKVEGNIEVLLDCVCLKITGKDKSNYSNPKTTERVFKLYHQLNENPLVVTSSPQIIHQFSHTGIYTFTLDTALLYEEEYYTVTKRLEHTVSKQVKCDKDLCALIACFDKYLKRVFYDSHLKGGCRISPTMSKTGSRK